MGVPYTTLDPSRPTDLRSGWRGKQTLGKTECQRVASETPTQIVRTTLNSPFQFRRATGGGNGKPPSPNKRLLVLPGGGHSEAISLIQRSQSMLAGSFRRVAIRC
jgi:hypothetical protein